MKNTFLFVCLFITGNLFGQVSQRCPVCPPSLNGVPNGWCLVDSAGFARWRPCGGGNNLSAGNGITISGDSIHLGGELFQDALINPNGNILAIGVGDAWGVLIGNTPFGDSSFAAFVNRYTVTTFGDISYEVSGNAMEVINGNSYTDIVGSSSELYHDNHIEQFRAANVLREIGFGNTASSIRSFDTLPDGQVIEYGLFNYLGENGNRVSNIYVGKTPHPDSTFRDIGSINVMWDTSGYTTISIQLAIDTNGFAGNPVANTIDVTQKEGIKFKTNYNGTISPNSGGQWNQYDLGVAYRIDGNSRFEIDTFGIITPGSMDSMSIYAITPTGGNGSQIYCNDCTGDGITGRLLTWISGAWRRLLFE